MKFQRRHSWRIWLIVSLVVATGTIAGVNFASSERAPAVVSIKSAATYQNAGLLTRAWSLDVAAIYRANPWDYQRNASFCGPTSLVNVARSLGQAETQDSIIEDAGVTTILGYVPMGLTLDELAALARHKIKRVTVRIVRDIDFARFREELSRANDPARRIVINFTREPLFGQGHGHHSPVLGYLVDEDLVFVGDVNADFKPWLVSSARLFEAMDTVDSSSGRKRGLLVLEQAQP